MPEQADSAVARTPAATPLRVKLARAERRNKVRAYGLILPLSLFLLVTFLIPISVMLYRSIDNPLLAEHFPRTLAALHDWDPAQSDTPPEQAYARRAEELRAARADKMIGRIATRLNYQTSGMRSLMTKTARKISRIEGDPPAGSWKAQLLEINKKWGKRDYWTTIRQAGEPLTLSYYLAGIDLRYDWDGSIVEQPEYKQIYVQVFGRTLWISVLVTVLCLVLAYPVAYLLATLPMARANLLMILVLLPFWTSLLVRTTAWVVVLQTEGVLNDLLVFLGLIDERIQLIYNRTGVVIAMTHILLPFMILPIYSVMKNVSPVYVRAARSLGATPFRAFWRVYFPQTVPGIGAGVLLVFILALGYYITPALIGGPTDQMASYFIADHTNRSLNWGLASALGMYLLVGVLAVYLIYNRFVGIDNMKLG